MDPVWDPLLGSYIGKSLMRVVQTPYVLSSTCSEWGSQIGVFRPILGPHSEGLIGPNPYESRLNPQCTAQVLDPYLGGIPLRRGTHPDRFLSSTCWESIRLRREPLMHSSGYPSYWGTRIRGIPDMGYMDLDAYTASYSLRSS